MKAAMIQANNFIIIPPYTALINACVFGLFEPRCVIQKEKMVMRNRNKFPTIKTSWSTFQRCSMFFPEIKNPFNTINTMTMGKKALGFLLSIILLPCRSFFYEFVNNHAKYKQRKQPNKKRNIELCPFVNFITHEQGYAERHKDLSAHSCITH